jgi:hypothetical protein
MSLLEWKSDAALRCGETEFTIERVRLAALPWLATPRRRRAMKKSAAMSERINCGIGDKG